LGRRARGWFLAPLALFALDQNGLFFGQVFHGNQDTNLSDKQVALRVIDALDSYALGLVFKTSKSVRKNVFQFEPL
jgi:hypothetical protein